MLTPILDATRSRVARLRGREAELERRAETMGPARPFGRALCGPGLAVIGEIKRRSPSAGALNEGLDPVQQAEAYAAGGAAALSVLTEPDFFAGSLADLDVVRRAVSVPVLRKDFVVDPIQILEARAWGADAVLLIVAVLGAEQLAVCLTVAAGVGLDALVEVHTAAEAEVARLAGASIVGVNNRDLRTFHTDLAVAERLGVALEGTPVTIAESGIATASDAARMARAGYDAVLVGEALVRAGDPGELVEALRMASS